MQWSTLLSSAAALLASTTAATTLLTNRTNIGVEFVSGNYVPYQTGFLGGLWELFYSSNNVTLRGTGYLRLRWEIEYWQQSGEAGDIIMDYNGTWLLAAGGGGYQMGDNNPAPYCNDPSGNCFNGTGGETDGYIWFSNGHNPWHDEYYWLDGEVYLQIQEGPGDYNVGVIPVTIDDILEDINTNTSSTYHYGAAFDPVEGACPCSIDPNPYTPASIVSVSSTTTVSSTFATLSAVVASSTPVVSSSITTVSSTSIASSTDLYVSSTSVPSTNTPPPDACAAPQHDDREKHDKSGEHDKTHFEMHRRHGNSHFH